MTNVFPMGIEVSTAVRTAHDLKLVSDLFHQINRVLPEAQKLLTLPPDMPAREAVAMLHARSFSQAPVMEGGTVFGVFSFRSFARRAAKCQYEELARQKFAPGDFSVEECIEQFEYARVTSEMKNVFDAMERDNGVLVGGPERLLGILTPMDVLRYLYNVASPFVMVSEIELTLRALIRVVLSPEEIIVCAIRSLAQHYGSEDKVPKTLEAMTFDNYRLIVGRDETWPKFSPLLGANKNRVKAKLQQIGELRNDLFHFKREISLEDHEILSEHRNWLLLTAQKAEIRAAGGAA